MDKNNLCIIKNLKGYRVNKINGSLYFNNVSDLINYVAYVWGVQ